jgi:glycosyltransferase involved in cell wall biosynthesis
MKIEKKISFIIPVFNGEKTIGHCLDSILEVKTEDIEIIVIDDGSRDSTYRILKDYASRNSIIKLFTQKNQGVSSARNAGLAVASGRYVSFVDCDDEVIGERIVEILKSIRNMKCEFICFDYYVCDGKEKKLNERQYLRPGLNSVKTIYQEILSGKFNNLWCNLYARDAITINKVRFKSEIKMGEDAIFNIEFLKNIRNCYYYKYPLYIYNNNSSGSAMHQYRIEYLKDYTVLFDYYKLIHEILPEAQLDLGAKHYLNKMFGCLFYTNDNIDETQYLDLVHSWFYKIVMEYPYYDVKNIFKKKFIEREYFKKKLFKTLIRVMIKE